MPGILVSLWWINKHYKATIDWKSSIKIIVASGLSGILTYLVTSQIDLVGWITLIIGSIVFLTSYVIIAPLIGAINYIDIQNLKAMLTSLGPLATLINPLLIPIEKITAHSQKD